ncbi:hypothetical protein [Pseudomonas spelaei]
MDYLQSGAALRYRWWQFGFGWGITRDRHPAGIFVRAVMSIEPSLRTNYEDYLNHEIRVEVFGPVKTNRQDANCLMTHYVAKLAIFESGSEVNGTRELLQEQYRDMNEAESAAFARGREIVDRVMAL